MPADLVPNEDIPKLAALIDPSMRKLLEHLQKTGFILNGGDIDHETAAILDQLTALGLVDPGYEGPKQSRPYIWVSNGNGSRALRYKTGIRAGPHYQIHSTELAAWIEHQGDDRWWMVDGDPLLTGRLAFPCPPDELVAELRRIGRPLLVQAKKDDAGAKGQVVKKDKLDSVAGRFVEIFEITGKQVGNSDRFLYLCWKESTQEWILFEDSETAAAMNREQVMKAK